MAINKLEVGARVSIVGDWSHEIYTIVRLGKDGDRCLLEAGEGTRCWFMNNAIQKLPNSQSDSKDRLVIIRREQGFDVHFNGMIADVVNFEEMLGCIIRSFSDCMGDEKRYFLRENTDESSKTKTEQDIEDAQ